MLTLCNATQEAGRRMFEALWKRIFGTRAAKAEPQRSAPTEETAYDPVVALRDQLRRDVLGGYFDEDAILTNAHDLFEEELPRPTLRREASAALRAAIASYLRSRLLAGAVTEAHRERRHRVGRAGGAEQRRRRRRRRRARLGGRGGRHAAEADAPQVQQLRAARRLRGCPPSAPRPRSTHRTASRLELRGSHGHWRTEQSGGRMVLATNAAGNGHSKECATGDTRVRV